MHAQRELEDRLTRDPEWMKHPVAAYLLKHSQAIILCLLLLALYGLFLSHKIDLVTADLGRHIKNGEILLQDPSVLSQNFYSYTSSDFPVVNHHWGSGFIFYLLWKSTGFVGVQFFFIILSLATLLIFLKAGRVRASWGILGIVALPAAFLLAERTEIRPEVFSYFFTGLFFYILLRFRESPEDPRRRKALWLLPLFQVLWVNLHIYFLLGPLLCGAFLFESLFQRKYFWDFLRIFGTLIIALFINPFGYKALTGAVTLFKNFGYRLAENQPLWFMEKLIRDPNFLIFKILFGALVLSYVVLLIRDRKSIRIVEVCIAAGIGTMAWLAIRNLSLFGFFVTPLLGGNLGAFVGTKVSERTALLWAQWLAAGVLLISVFFMFPRYFPYWQTFGWGVERQNDAAISFIERNSIQGPYFNNYDIGGYLIFHLFPKERVFVDNRPEAYPSEFFQKTYIPMQEDDAVWQVELERHRFNAIIFSHQDATPWGQRFLIERLQDPLWAPVFVDSRVLIFLRNTPANEKLIEHFKVSKELFSVSNQ